MIRQVLQANGRNLNQILVPAPDKEGGQMAGQDPFERDHRPVVGQAILVRPGIRVITAPNPGMMTFTGTQTYLLSDPGGRPGPVTIIDPGPDDPAHLAAILRALAPGEAITRILVTHAHLDHVGLVPALVAETAAPVLGFGPVAEARSPAMAALAAQADIGGGEGLGDAFCPDIRLIDQEELDGPGYRLTALHTPGHLADHLCFGWSAGQGEPVMFSGDHVMGWSSTLISPPDGDLAAFRMALEKVMAREERTYLPGHGGPVADGPAMARHQLAHRGLREAQILEALLAGPTVVTRLVASLYREVDPKLHPAAARNVLAHLIDLEARGAVAREGPLGLAALFRIPG